MGHPRDLGRANDFFLLVTGGNDLWNGRQGPLDASARRYFPMSYNPSKGAKQ
jgi:hypothetical protein